MGARGKNFYNELVSRYGYEGDAKRIQDLYLGGKKDEAAAAVPDALVDEVALCGPRERLQERLPRWKTAGITTLICGAVQPEALELMAELALSRREARGPEGADGDRPARSPPRGHRARGPRADVSAGRGRAGGHRRADREVARLHGGRSAAPGGGLRRESGRRAPARGGRRGAGPPRRSRPPGAAQRI